MQIIGILAMIASLTIIFVGLPAQIYKNWKLKSTLGLSTGLMVAALFTYTLWAIYGWTKPDYFLAVAQTPGCVLAVIIIIQIIIYRRRDGCGLYRNN